MNPVINDGQMAYTAYGFTRQRSASLVSFNGQRHDPVTDCYPLGNGHRSFSPILMRFLSPDAYSPFARGGGNAYAYCLGDPINADDPSGRVPRFLKVIREVFFGRPSRVQREAKGVLQSQQILAEEKRQAGAHYSAFESMFDQGAPEYKRTRIFEYLEGLPKDKYKLTVKYSEHVAQIKSSIQALELLSDRSMLYSPLPQHVSTLHAKKINGYRQAILRSQAPGTSAKAKASEIALHMHHANLVGELNKNLSKRLKYLRQTS